MRHTNTLLLVWLITVSGCLYQVREETERGVADITARPYDLTPSETSNVPGAEKTNRLVPDEVPARAIDDLIVPGDSQPRLRVPAEVPGSTAPAIALPADAEGKRREALRLYPALPPLTPPPTALPGPGGKPYTLGDFQRIAAENSPTLRQAASDVEAAKGNLIQARAYPNPTVSYQVQPSNDGSTAGVQGIGIDQTIKTAGKLKLQAAAAQKALDNSELALNRARGDLATQVRSAYFALLVGRESMMVNLALARFTEQVYTLQAELLANGFAAAYEPAALRAQAFSSRLAYKQALEAYCFGWKQLVVAIGLRQLPLSEVEGRIDHVIPFFDYDDVLAHVLRNHTDLQVARNGIEQARYNLKLAQVTPVPDIDVQFAVLKETASPPFQWVHTVQIGVPIPVWDRNKGNIIAQEAALVRASEESHRVELVLTNQVATNYQSYKSNLDALEYYRTFILPDQVQTFRGVYERRRIDPNTAFGDLVQAQQTLATNVQSYLGILGQLWSSVVAVADPLQTDDLFGLARGTRELQPLPDIDRLLPLPGCHMAVKTSGSEADVAKLLPAAPALSPAVLPTLRTLPAP